MISPLSWIMVMQIYECIYGNIWNCCTKLVKLISATHWDMHTLFISVVSSEVTPWIANRNNIPLNKSITKIKKCRRVWLIRSCVTSRFKHFTMLTISIRYMTFCTVANDHTKTKTLLRLVCDIFFSSNTKLWFSIWLGKITQMYLFRWMQIS